MSKKIVSDQNKLNSLVAEVEFAQTNLRNANIALNAFEDLPENNVYPTIEDALAEIEGELQYGASLACEGAHNCGDEEYTQVFIVDGVKYIATLVVEYNCHDKTYYYVDGTEFSYEQVE